MRVEIEVLKDIPKEQINKFEDRVVYYTALETREHVKMVNGYPYRTGRLRRTEVATPITGTNKEYNLLTGVGYAKQVYNYTNVNWTNPSTLPQWYHTAFRSKGNTFIQRAVNKSLKELK